MVGVNLNKSALSALADLQVQYENLMFKANRLRPLVLPVADVLGAVFPRTIPTIINIGLSGRGVFAYWDRSNLLQTQLDTLSLAPQTRTHFPSTGIPPAPVLLCFLPYLGMCSTGAVSNFLWTPSLRSGGLVIFLRAVSKKSLLMHLPDDRFATNSTRLSQMTNSFG